MRYRSVKSGPNIALKINMKGRGRKTETRTDIALRCHLTFCWAWRRLFQNYREQLLYSINNCISFMPLQKKAAEFFLTIPPLCLSEIWQPLGKPRHSVNAIVFASQMWSNARMQLQSVAERTEKEEGNGEKRERSYQDWPSLLPFGTSS